MRIITVLSSVILLVLFTCSCKNEKSLQSYLVDTSGKEGFYTGDLPVSSILSANSDVSEDIRKTIKSVKKINIVFLPKTADNSLAYEIEKEKLNAIFKGNEVYKSLMSMKVKGMNVNMYYSGDTENIDEVIAFGYGENTGVGVARLLGENMNPLKIIENLSSTDFNEDNPALKQFLTMFTE
jgi:DNA-dependent RNA polymerase auxiliary subunit epsilon|tara:strand:+ start:675 stop:1217 length:543 start_codon:yes stop_codon:yes gene_type:complete